jgi:hypothetical protein
MPKATHRQELALITLINIITGYVVEKMISGEIPVPSQYAWLVGLFIVVVNSRSMWLPGLFDLGRDEVPADDLDPALRAPSRKSGRG